MAKSVCSPRCVFLSEIDLSTILLALNNYYAVSEQSMPSACVELSSRLANTYREMILDTAEELLDRANYH